VAQKIQTLFIDDLDGTEAEGTVRFALDGTEYEIDLNAGVSIPTNPITRSGVFVRGVSEAA